MGFRLAWIGNVGRHVGSMGPLRVRISYFFFGCGGSWCLIVFVEWCVLIQMLLVERGLLRLRDKDLLL